MTEFKPISPVNLWALGAVYQRPDGSSVTILHMTEHMVLVKTMDSFAEHIYLDKNKLAGPTHIPCPFCGKLTILQTDGLQIDTAEHLMRCRIVRGIDQTNM